ncbi:MAG: 30S ribosomal protein THX [Bernardetiaceae bacterium]|jgi:ribosomal small subunit protein bTHX|nr:30S ribosomal protein THX [Bernardetiaceae bacterium]
MGKGDKKTRRGKIAIGSYGNSRPHKDNSKAAAAKTTKK